MAEFNEIDRNIQAYEQAVVAGDAFTATAPGFETGRDIIEFSTEKNAIDGTPLAFWGRALTGVALFTPFSGVVIRKVFGAVETAVDASRTVDRVEEAVETSQDLARNTPSSNINVVAPKTPTDRYKGELFENEGALKTESALRGAQTELAGGKTRAAVEHGRDYDHVTKVRNAQRGLKNRIQVIKSQLQRGNLADAGRSALQSELSEASWLLDMSEGFVP